MFFKEDSRKLNEIKIDIRNENYRMIFIEQTCCEILFVSHTKVWVFFEYNIIIEQSLIYYQDQTQMVQEVLKIVMIA